MELPTQDEASGWPGSPVRDDQGAVLGECVGVFADAETDVTDWLDINVPGHGHVLVPALDALKVDGQLHVSYPRDLVLSAPRVDAEHELARQDEIRLYDHYGVEYSNEQSATLLPAGVEIASSEPKLVTRATKDAVSAPAADVPAGAPAAPPGTRSAPAAAGVAPRATTVPPERAAVLTTSSGDREQPTTRIQTQADAPPVTPTAPTAEPQPSRDVPASPAPPVAGNSRPTSPRPLAIVPAGGVSPADTAPQERIPQKRPTPANAVAVAVPDEAVAVPDEADADTGPASLPIAAPVRDGALSALTPLAVIIGLAVAVAVAVRARDLRTRRRKSAARVKRRRQPRVRSNALQASRRRAVVPRAAPRTPFGLVDVLRSTSRAAARPGKQAARRAVATPRLIAAGERRARRALWRPIWRGAILAAAGAGYTAGASAGTVRYEQLRDTAVRLARSQPVQQSRAAAAEQVQRRRRDVVAALDRRGATPRAPGPGEPTTTDHPGQAR